MAPSSIIFATLALFALISVASANHGPVSFAFSGVRNTDAASTDGASFTGTWNAATRELFLTITHTVTDATAMHIHGNVSTPFADAGSPWAQSAGVILPIATNASDAASPVRRRYVLTADQQASICGKLAYFVIHSTAAPNGAVGAVIMMDCTVRAVPFSFSGFDSTGMAASTVSFDGLYNPGSKTMSVIIQHPLTDATLIHIHGATPNAFTLGQSPYAQSAGVLKTLAANQSQAISPFIQTFNVDQATHDAICAKKAYFNIHSTALPNGAYGAAIFIECDPKVVFNSRVVGTNAAITTNATFAGILNIAQKRLSMIITHELTDATAGHIHGEVTTPFTASGANLGGQSAGVLFTLIANAGDAIAPVVETYVLTDAIIMSMCNNKTYFALHSTAYPAGAYVSALTLDCSSVAGYGPMTMSPVMSSPATTSSMTLPSPATMAPPATTSTMTPPRGTASASMTGPVVSVLVALIALSFF